MKYPRILLLTQPFDTISGGGITLTNLFRNWNRENIALMFVTWGQVEISNDICNIFYKLGSDEHKWRFPFNLIKKPFPASGLVKMSVNTPGSYSKEKTGIKKFISDYLLNPFLNWIGINHCNSSISLSPRLKAWLADYRPEILYMHFSTLEEIVFARQVISYLKIPSAIHMMDDWPSLIGTKGPLKFYWHRKIDRELRLLLSEADLHLSISEAMSSEYKQRYNLNFIPFHNPIETTRWLTDKKEVNNIDRNNVVILYAGRIGRGISESLIEVASAIDSMDEEMNIRLHIQTTDRDHYVLDRLEQFRCVVINPVVSYEKIPMIFSQADIMLLANDFDIKALDFLRFSMPTKASEYMISGTPVIVYAPQDSAISKFFSQNECGYCVTSRGEADILNAIRVLINDDEYRLKLSRNAVKIAKAEFDAEKVRKRFHELLVNMVNDPKS